MAERRSAVVVLEQPLDAPEGSRMEVVGAWHCLQQRHPGLRSTKLRPVVHHGFPTDHLAEASERRAEWKSLLELGEGLKDLPGTRVPVLLERPAPATGRRGCSSAGIAPCAMSGWKREFPRWYSRSPKGSLTRLEMARWLVGDQNPLAARVLAEPALVRTDGAGHRGDAGGFGTSGARPTHPELLDFRRPARGLALVGEAVSARGRVVVRVCPERPGNAGIGGARSRKSLVCARAPLAPDCRDGPGPGVGAFRIAVLEGVWPARVSSAAGRRVELGVQR